MQQNPSRSSAKSAVPWPQLLDLWTTFARAPAHEIETAAVDAMTTLRDLVSASYAFLLFGVRARPSQHPRGGALISNWFTLGMLQDPDEPQQRKAIREAWVAEGRYAIDEGVQTMVAGAGRRRVLRQQEMASPEVWESSAARDLLVRLGASDRLVAAVPLTEDLEVCMTFDREPPAPLFDAAAKQVALAGLVGLSPRLQTLASVFGLDYGALTTPRERGLIAALMTGASEQEVADAVGLTQRSTHQRVVGLYRKLHVHSRAELMARFLGKLPQGAGWGPS